MANTLVIAMSERLEFFPDLRLHICDEAQSFLRHRLSGVDALGDLIDVVCNAGGLPQQLGPLLFGTRLHPHTEDHIADKRLDLQSGQLCLLQQVATFCVRQTDGDFSLS